ncbi:MAG: ester cyclase [Pseudomonadota bacterium]
MGMKTVARDFFEACETGKGWEACEAYCTTGATFSCQADALADVVTLEGYTKWMKGLLRPIVDGHYELKAFAEDEDAQSVIAVAVFQGTHSGEGGPMPATGKTVASDYVYVMNFDGGKIRHMTKIWNDGPALRSLGWA